MVRQIGIASGDILNLVDDSSVQSLAYQIHKGE